MGQMYSIAFDNVSITNANGDADLFQIAPADDRIVILHALFLDQISDIGDAMEEMLRFAIVRGETTGASGTSVTPQKMHHNQAAAGATCGYYDASIMTSGTPVNLHLGAFNIRSGLQLIWTPEMRPVVSQPQTNLVVRLLAAPADDITMSGTLYFEEIG